MSAGHHHGHHHHHEQEAASVKGRAFALAVALNLGFTAAEIAAGLVSGSMALIADAGHNLSDVLALLLAWGANTLSSRPPSERYTYGLKSSSILAAIANAALLWLAFVGIPAFDAWLSADPLRPVALGVGGLALVTLAVVRMEVGE